MFKKSIDRVSACGHFKLEDGNLKAIGGGDLAEENISHDVVYEV